jgi:hypothetical protein
MYVVLPYSIKLAIGLCVIRGTVRTVCASVHLEHPKVFLCSIFYDAFKKAGGSRWRSWFRHCGTNRKVAGSIPDCAIGIFH